MHTKTIVIILAIFFGSMLVVASYLSPQYTSYVVYPTEQQQTQQNSPSPQLSDDKGFSTGIQLSPETKTSVQEKKCVQTNNDMDLTKKGKVITSEGKTYTDTCIGNNIEKYYCNNNAVAYIIQPCDGSSYGAGACVDGACIKTTPSPTTPSKKSFWEKIKNIFGF